MKDKNDEGERFFKYNDIQEVYNRICNKSATMVDFKKMQEFIDDYGPLKNFETRLKTNEGWSSLEPRLKIFPLSEEDTVFFENYVKKTNEEYSISKRENGLLPFSLKEEQEIYKIAKIMRREQNEELKEKIASVFLVVLLVSIFILGMWKVGELIQSIPTEMEVIYNAKM